MRYPGRDDQTTAREEQEEIELRAWSAAPEASGYGTAASQSYAPGSTAGPRPITGTGGSLQQTTGVPGSEVKDWATGKGDGK